MDAFDDWTQEELLNEFYTGTTSQTNEKYELNLKMEIEEEEAQTKFFGMCKCTRIWWAYIDR